MRKPLYHASVYGIIRNNSWDVLVAQRWEKASWFVWRYQIPAGHMDGQETVFEALKREIYEELTIWVEETDVELKHTVHRRFEDGREYFDFYFEVNSYTWKVQIWEPEKCSDVQFVSPNKLNEIKLLQHDKIALENIEKQIPFTELFLKNNQY